MAKRKVAAPKTTATAQKIARRASQPASTEPTDHKPIAPAAQPRPAPAHRAEVKVGQQLLYLSRGDIERLPWENGEVFNHVQVALREHGRGKVQMPVGATLQPHRQSLLAATPAFVPNVQACGLKWVSRFPYNAQMNLPQVSALTLLADPHSGLPLAMMDSAWLASQSGPAISATAIKLLARPESTTAAIIGVGVQGCGHIPVLAQTLPKLERIRLFDVDADRLAVVVRQWQGRLGRPVQLEPVRSAPEAVRDADVLVSATAYNDKPAPTVPLDWVRNGALVVSLDLDSVFSPKVFLGVDRFYVDSVEDLEVLRRAGLFQKGLPDHITGLLSQVVVGRVPGRGAAAERIACLNLGLACVDVVLARAIFEKACKLGIGQTLKL